MGWWPTSTRHCRNSPRSSARRAVDLTESLAPQRWHRTGVRRKYGAKGSGLMVDVKDRPKARGAERTDTMALNIRKIGVIGAGQMGSGIAHVCSLAGLNVLLNDVSA